MTRLTVSFRAAWKVLRRAPERDSTGQPSDPWLEMIRQHEGLTDEELLARIAAIDDAHPGIPSTWQACRDTLNHLGNVANSTEWQRARLVVIQITRLKLTLCTQHHPNHSGGTAGNVI